MSINNKGFAKEAFSITAYYIIFSLFLVWIIQICLFCKSINFSIIFFIKKYWVGILCSLVMTIVVFSSVEVKFKTLSDETNLLSISKSMLEQKNCFNVTQGKYYYNRFYSIDNDRIPNKHLAHPFIIHLIHLVTGYRYQNGFVLNFILLWLLLSGAYVFIRGYADQYVALSIIFLILSYPVISIFSTCSGYDLMNCFFYYLIIAISLTYIKEPSSQKIGFIITSLIIFVNIRYESIFLLILLPVLLIPKMKLIIVKDNSFLLSLSPIFCLPLIWQKIVNIGTWQKMSEKKTIISMTSFNNFSNIFISNFFKFDNDLPFSNILNLLAFFICVVILILIFARNIRLNKVHYYSIIVFCAPLITHTIIILSSFFGSYDHPISTRYFMILSISCSVLVIYFTILKSQIIRKEYLFLLSIICFVFFHTIAVNGNMNNRLTSIRKMDKYVEFIEKQNDRNVLIITERPGQYVALGYGAIGFHYANNRSKLINDNMKNNLFSKVYVFQEITYATGLPNKSSILKSNYTYKTRYKLQINSSYYIRISEISIE
jgi:hypothetical protein